MEECGDGVSPLLSLVPELRMNTQFVLVDLEASFRVLMNAKSAVEKRLHLINIRADIYESYKLLYGYGKSRHHTAWSKIGVELQLLQDDDGHKQLKKEYDAITPLVVRIKTSLRARITET